MTLEEMKLAAVEELPALLVMTTPNWYHWRPGTKFNTSSCLNLVHWEIEGLTICLELEKTLDDDQYLSFMVTLADIARGYTDDKLSWRLVSRMMTADYEQKLEAFCRTKWPYKFKTAV